MGCTDGLAPEFRRRIGAIPVGDVLVVPRVTRGEGGPASAGPDDGPHSSFDRGAGRRAPPYHCGERTMSDKLIFNCARKGRPGAGHAPLRCGQHCGHCRAGSGGPLHGRGRRLAPRMKRNGRHQRSRDFRPERPLQRFVENGGQVWLCGPAQAARYHGGRRGEGRRHRWRGQVVEGRGGRQRRSLSRDPGFAQAFYREGLTHASAGRCDLSAFRRRMRRRKSPRRLRPGKVEPCSGTGTMSLPPRNDIEESGRTMFALALGPRPFAGTMHRGTAAQRPSASCVCAARCR